MKSLVVLIFSVLLSLSSQAESLQSRMGYVYWGLGPNFGLLGNLRFGFESIEGGILQGTGFGLVFVQRTSTPIFFQLGLINTAGGSGVLGGGGLEWSATSQFRLRTDITVSTDTSYQTQGFVSVGGVFIL